MGWNQTRPMGSGANRVGSKIGNEGGTHMGGVPSLHGHPSGQQRIGAHPNQNNAKTGIRTQAPSKVGFNNRVGRKTF